MKEGREGRGRKEEEEVRGRRREWGNGEREREMVERKKMGVEEEERTQKGRQ